MASKKRVVCGLSVAAVWLAAIFLLPVWALAGVLAAGAIVCLYELCAMLKHRGYTLPFKTLAVASALWFAGMYGAWFLCTPATGMPHKVYGLGLILLPIVLFFGLTFWHLLSAKIEKPLETLALSLFSAVYIPASLSLFLIIVAGLSVFPEDCACDPSTNTMSGIFVALVLVLVTKMSDTGGYFIGSAFGKHKMCPRLSPGKSWEGTAGGYAFSLLSAGAMIGLAHAFPGSNLLCSFYRLTETPGKALWLLGTVVLLVTVGILGDLFESLFKRQCGVKDSSALFPAMGGFFDTFDSIIFVPAVFLLSYFVARYCGLDFNLYL